MDHPVRTFKGVSPSLGQRVYVDKLATVIGNVKNGYWQYVKVSK